MNKNEQIDFSTPEGQQNFDKLSDEEKEKIVKDSHFWADAVEEKLKKTPYKNIQTMKSVNELKEKINGDIGSVESIKNELKNLAEKADDQTKKTMNYILEEILNSLQTGEKEKSLDLTEKDFELFANLYGKDIKDFSGQKNLKCLEVGNFNDSQKLIIQQDNDFRFELIKMSELQWNDWIKKLNEKK